MEQDRVRYANTGYSKAGAAWTSSALAWLVRTFPRTGEFFKRRFVEWFVPLNRSAGIRVDHVEPDSSLVVLRLRPRRRNTNSFGTVHGGIVLALAESVHGVAVLWQFAPAGHSMVTRRAQIEYLASARGTLCARYSLPADMVQWMGGQLAECGRCDVDLESEVQDASGRVVARLRASYVVRKRVRR